MFRRFLAAAALLLLAPIAHAQVDPTAPHYAEKEEVTASLYGSGGLAWSGELGLEFELGGRVDIGKVLQLRFSPLNVSLFDGDLPPGYFWGEDDSLFDDDCYDASTGYETIDAYCDLETDSEWRSVVEAQLNLGGGFYLGAGAAYLLQGDFKPQDGRVASFLSLSAQVDRELAVEFRAGTEYVSLRLASAW